MPVPTLVVAATGSGCGKTTVTAGLIAALRRRGLAVQPFKCGPDYIDPGYLSRAAGRSCRNLDSWMLDDAQVAAAFTRASRGADIAVVEGVMGLFDGSGFTDERASSAQIAKLLGAPVLLVLDISGAARSAAAMALGFSRLDPALRVGGCVLNLAGGETHAHGCAAAIRQLAGLPTLGWLPRDPALRVPERHLGLATAGEQADLDALLATLADTGEQRFDLDAILRLARTALPPEADDPSSALPPPSRLSPAASVIPPSSVVRPPPSAASPLLAVARDAAFCFYYPDNLDLLADAGARLAFFSPLAGERPPADAAGVYLGGGYPELHAAALAANTGFLADLRALHSRHAPIFAECGGFMMLAETLIDGDGRSWPLAGLVPGTVRMTSQLAALGYRHATAPRANLLADAGTTLRGHEFHYSVWDHPASGLPHAWQLRGTAPDSRTAPGGYAARNLLASYLHIHFGQSPALAPRFVEQLRRSTAAVVAT
jgi:cobyrinic acid a,c-diamide synthase